jgi:Zn-dependent peptidase ImmA (M78 family)/DNA-binding XRE family transcriptional regulator
MTMLGERLRQARLLANLSQEDLAQQMTQQAYSITKQAISKYEKNLSYPPAQFLILAAQILAVPSSYFFHQTQADVQWLAFRRASDLAVSEQESVKAYARDVVELQIELQTLLHPQAQVDLPETRLVTSFEEAEALAMSLREQWDLDLQAIESLVQTAEDHGVVVIAWEKTTDKFDGLSGWCGKQAVTVLRMDVEPERRRFTLAHELGHLLMNTAHLEDRSAEKLANRFAATLLVPTERAFHELGKRRTRLDWDELGILKRKYGLSMAAWLKRAEDLEIISHHYAKQLWIELKRKGWHQQEPVPYIGDESPLLLEQMAHHANAEGLMSSDRIQRAYPKWKEAAPVAVPERFSIYDLLALPEDEREQKMAEAYALANAEDYELFEAQDFYDYDEDGV